MPVTIPEETAQVFKQYRGQLFSIAYRMLGSASDAEDTVQEAFLRWLQAGVEDLQSPKAYLTAIIVRLCIDQMRAARTRREVYPGPWLPEPIPTSRHPELVETAILAESLSFAFMVMLERLSALERAVFLLREVFDYDYAEIAAMIDKSEANCRQILHRAHQHLDQRRPRFAVSREQQERITRQFLHASMNGDMQGIHSLLTDDVVFTGDGGGKVQAGLKPVYGPDKVTRGLLSGFQKVPSSAEAWIEEVNGQPAIVAYVEGRPYGVIVLDVAEGHVCGIYLVVNPDKLQRMVPQSG